MVTILWIILVSQVGYSAEVEYPDWFIYQYKYPSFFVGFKHADIDAKVDALERNTCYFSSQISGYKELLLTKNSRIITNSNYKYFYSIDQYNILSKLVLNGDGFCSNALIGDYIQSFETDTTNKVSYIAYHQIDDIAIPPWINRTVWIEDGYYYSVGQYPNKGNENDAWIKAEDNAVLSLLNFVKTEMYTKTIIKNEKASESSVLDYYLYKYDFFISNLRIVERYPDLVNGYHYCLIKIRMDNISVSQ